MSKSRKEVEQGPTSASSVEDAGEGLYFDLDRIVVPVKIKGKDGKIKEFELREATGDAACRWRNVISSKMILGPDGKPERMGNIADAEPVLVALCLYPKGSDNNVKVELVRSWPSRIQKALFKTAMEISDLKEEAAALESAKNEPEDTLDG